MDRVLSDNEHLIYFLYMIKEKEEGWGQKGTMKRNRYIWPREKMEFERAERSWLGKSRFTLSILQRAGKGPLALSQEKRG